MIHSTSHVMKQSEWVPGLKEVGSISCVLWVAAQLSEVVESMGHGRSRILCPKNPWRAFTDQLGWLVSGCFKGPMFNIWSPMDGLG